MSINFYETCLEIQRNFLERQLSSLEICHKLQQKYQGSRRGFRNRDDNYYKFYEKSLGICGRMQTTFDENLWSDMDI